MKSKLYDGPVLVTGASRGIGRAVALMLADQGFKVYCASRSGETPMENENLVRIAMDVTDPASVDAAAAKIDDLQVIVHCAGFGIAGSCEGVDTAGAKSQLNTNFFGVISVNHRFLPMLRRHSRSLVVITGSVAGLIPIPYQAHYSCSKYALEAYTECLRMEGHDFGIRASIVEPGDTHTSFTSKRQVLEGSDSPYYETCLKSVKKMASDETNGKSPETAARAIVRMLSRREPPVRCAVGFEYKLFSMLKRLLPARFIEFLLRKMYIPTVR